MGYFLSFFVLFERGVFHGGEYGNSNSRIVIYELRDSYEDACPSEYVRGKFYLLFFPMRDALSSYPVGFQEFESRLSPDDQYEGMLNKLERRAESIPYRLYFAIMGVILLLDISMHFKTPYLVKLICLNVFLSIYIFGGYVCYSSGSNKIFDVYSGISMIVLLGMSGFVYDAFRRMIVTEANTGMNRGHRLHIDR